MKRPVSEGSNPIGQRLRLAMEKCGISSAELAKRADVKTSFLYDVISGKSANPSPLKLARVAEQLGISLAWLVGSGMAADSQPGKTPHPDYVAVPRAVLAAASSGGTVISAAQEDEIYHFRKDWIETHLCAKSENLRLFQVSGDSMEPTLCHNDIALIDTARKTPTPPGIFLLYDGFGLVPKRLEYLTQPQPPRIRIISDNPQYSSYDRSVEETFIIGRVVWFAREM